MKHYPIFLNIKNRSCLVVGSGPVGLRKAAGLLKSGAQVTVVSLASEPGFDSMKEQVTFRHKAYAPSDLDGVFMAFAATDNAALNRQIREDARQRNILCSIADAPDLADFIVPSVFTRGDLSVAVSTAGSSPAMARTVKKELESLFGQEYADLLELFRKIREKLLASGHDPDTHKKKFYRLVASDILEWIREGRIDRIDETLAEIFGDGFRYRDLAGKRSYE